jgi:hypothetical protein
MYERPIRGRRFTVVAALTLDGVVAGHVVEDHYGATVTFTFSNTLS